MKIFKLSLFIVLIFLLYPAYCEEMLSYTNLKQSNYVFINTEFEDEGFQLYTVYKNHGVDFQGFKKMFFLTDEVYYVLVKNKEYFVVGKISKKGIFGSNGNLLYQENDKYDKIYGVCSETLNFPFSPNYVYRDENGKYHGGDTIAPITIDYKNKSLILFDPWS